MRISPYGVFNGMAPDSSMDELYDCLIAGLNDLGVAYIHVGTTARWGRPPSTQP
jgi:N-ethylmaleimide reductase